jgi:hypothetical protein
VIRLTGEKHRHHKKIEKPVDSISEPLLKKMSSERTRGSGCADAATTKSRGADGLAALHLRV